MKLLKPQPLIPRYYEPVQADLEQVFFDLVFKPVVAVIKEATPQPVIINTTLDALEQALKTGRVQYDDGIFSGQFSAAISRALRSFGAALDDRDGTYRIKPELMPANIRVIAQNTAAEARRSHDLVLKALDEAAADVERAQQAGWEVGATGLVERVDADYRAVAKELTVSPDLSDFAKANLAADYNKSMSLNIRGWAHSQIEALREQVEENAKTGYRFDTLIDRIKHQYSTTQSKAEFLARQETGLYMAKFRRESLTSVGVNGYVWHARSASLTRPAHWALNNRLYLYSQPPVTSPDGRHNNPGEDFNCLCVDRPVLGQVMPHQIGQIYKAA